jgi:transmembrane sensor
MDSSPSISRRLLQGSVLALLLLLLRSAADVQAPTCSAQTLHLQSNVGERLFSTLQDGSAATLNTNTEFISFCSREGRLSRLLKGEVEIRVRHERAPSPFILLAGNTAVEDVGTGFTARIKQNSVEIAVTDGTVRVYPRVDASSQLTGDAPLKIDGSAVELHKGARVSINSETGELTVLPELNADGMNRYLSWRIGNISLDQVSLAEAVAEFNRYTQSQYTLSGIPPQYAEKPLTGYFDEVRIDDFLTAAEKALDVHFRKSQDAQGNTELTVAEAKLPHHHGPPLQNRSTR